MLIDVLCVALLFLEDTNAPSFSEQQWAVVQSLSPAIFETDSTNAFETNDDAAILGQSIFFDTRFSSNQEVACATCHVPEKYFTDGKPISVGVGETKRNSPTLLNTSHQRWFFWDGRTDTLWGQPIQTMEHPDEMNLPREHAVAIIAEDDLLSSQWGHAFGEIKLEEVDENAAKIAKSLASYITKLDASHAPFDDFVAGNKDAISPSAQRGLKYFITDGGCLRCHFGPWFSDGAFHSVGVGPLGGGPLRDGGRATAIDILKKSQFTAGSQHSDDPNGLKATLTQHIAQRREDWGAFRTPSLRNVSKTAPYMHAGQLNTLEDVVDHYSTLENFVSADHHRETILEPLNLSEQQKRDLIAFLETLTAPLPDDSLLRELE